MSIAPKHDQDLYEKPDLSLIPWSILITNYNECGTHTYKLAQTLHRFLNHENTEVTDMPFDIDTMLRASICEYGVYPLAVALGYGCVKYARDSWKRGFHDDVRLFKAALRHCDAILRGFEYDGQVIEGYPKGLPHRGAVTFNLLVVSYEHREQ